MPHNCQWSYEELHNARRQAEIEAEAMRKVLREEQNRREREAQRQAYSSRCPRGTSYVEEPPRGPNPEFEAAMQIINAQKQLKEKARWIFERRYSITRVWLEQRYGWKNVWEAIKRTVRSYHCNLDEAVQILCRNYAEEDWKDCIDTRLEAHIRDLQQGKEI